MVAGHGSAGRGCASAARRGGSQRAIRLSQKMQNRFFIKRCSRKRTVSRAFVTHHQEGMSFVGLFARAATRNVFTNSGRKKWDQEPRFGTASSADKDAPKSYRCTHRGRKQYGRMRLWRLHRLSGTRSQIFSGFWKDEDASEIFMNVRRVEARTPILSTPSPSSTHRQDATSSLFFSRVVSQSSSSPYHLSRDISRFSFYDRANKAFAVVQTLERRPCAV